MLPILVFGLVFGTAFVALQYRYARLGSPPSIRWRLVLLLVGIGTGALIGYLMASSSDSTMPASKQGDNTALFGVVTSAAIFGVASAWLVPRGMRLSLDFAERGKSKRK